MRASLGWNEIEDDFFIDPMSHSSIVFIQIEE